jgi:hypothetical protein
MPDLRRAPRHRLLKAGAISYRGGRMTCAIRNLSKHGARLEVQRPGALPRHFVLVIEMEHKRRRCDVVWRKNKSLGVHFSIAV